MLLWLVATTLLFLSCSSCVTADLSELDDEQPLSTYYLDVTAPSMTVVEEPRPGVTRMQLRLAEQSVPPRMPVIIASANPGVLHTVVHTWDWLQKYAKAHVIAGTSLKAKQGFRRQVFPLPGVALKSAYAMVPPEEVHPDIETTMKNETKFRLSTTHPAAPSALLMLPGHATAAIADVLYLQADGDDVIFTFDVIHDPHVFSEFKKHGLQMHNKAAHYHFYAPVDVDINAERFQQTLEQADWKPEVVSIFFKGLPDHAWHWHLWHIVHPPATKEE